MPKTKTLDEALWRHGALTNLAEAVGVSRSYLCDIRKGRSRPSKELAQRISEITGVPVASLMRPAA